MIKTPTAGKPPSLLGGGTPTSSLATGSTFYGSMTAAGERKVTKMTLCVSALSLDNAFYHVRDLVDFANLAVKFKIQSLYHLFMLDLTGGKQFSSFPLWKKVYFIHFGISFPLLCS